MAPVVVGVSELSQALIDAGNNLLKLHSSTDGLLTLLDEFETLLSNVEQDLPVSVQDALIPSMKALISADLLRNSNSDVRVSVVSCLTEIMRITAPEAPYNDSQMKEIFQMTIEAFGKLADASCRSYRKAVVILDTVSKIRSCLVMLDLECDELILEMFRQFLKIISPDHSQPVLLSMETIMITVIDESEEISIDLLDILLTTVKKENQDVSPMSLKLVEKVLSRCAHKLKLCIMEALKSKGTSLDMYSSVVSLICQSESATTQVCNIVNNKEAEADEKKGQVAASDQLKDNLDLGASGKGIPSKNRSKRSARDGTHRINGNEKIRNEIDLKQSLKQGLSESTDAETESGSTRKRGRKPNSLMNPEEGYDHSWVSGRKKSSKTPSSKKVQEKELSDSSMGKPSAKKTPLPKESSTSPAKVGQTNQSVVISFPSSSRARTGSRKRSRVKMVETGHDTDSFSSPTSKKESIQVVKKEPPEEEHVMESNLEKTEDSSKPTKSGKKVRAQNGLAKTVTKKPLAETKMVKTSGKKSGQSGAEKKNSEGTSTETVVPKSSKRKKMASQTEITSSTKRSKQTPKTHPKKRTATKETEADMHDLGEELVGKRVNVWWPLDEMFYAGIVDSYCSLKKMHRVSYSDGDSEELNLKKERWEIIEDKSTANEQDEEIDLPESIPLCDLIQRRKAKKRKSVPANEEPSESPEAKSSAKTLEKTDSEAKFSKQVKRTKGSSKTVSNEPKTKEQNNVKPSEKSNAESGRTKARTGRNQKVTQARSRKNKKDSDEKEESETKGEDSLKSQEEANSEPESKTEHQQPPEDSNAEPKTDGEEQESSKEPTKSEEKRQEDGKETHPNISETGKVEEEVKEESDKAELGNSSVSADR